MPLPLGQHLPGIKSAPHRLLTTELTVLCELCICTCAQVLCLSTREARSCSEGAGFSGCAVSLRAVSVSQHSLYEHGQTEFNTCDNRALSKPPHSTKSCFCFAEQDRHTRFSHPVHAVGEDGSSLRTHLSSDCQCSAPILQISCHLPIKSRSIFLHRKNPGHLPRRSINLIWFSSYF